VAQWGAFEVAVAVAVSVARVFLKCIVNAQSCWCESRVEKTLCAAKHCVIFLVPSTSRAPDLHYWNSHISAMLQEKLN
jgi:hypothetical protein